MNSNFTGWLREAFNTVKITQTHKNFSADISLPLYTSLPEQHTQWMELYNRLLHLPLTNQQKTLHLFFSAYATTVTDLQKSEVYMHCHSTSISL